MNPNAGLDAAIRIIQSAFEASLGTVEDGAPFVSGTGFLFLNDPAAEARILGGRLYLLLSDLAQHTRNLKKNSHASLLIVEKKDDLPIHEKKRLTFQGQVRRIEDPEVFERLKTKYLEIFPRSEIFFGLPDFHFYELEVSRVHWIGGFGKAGTWP